jgi:hypothetical protein
MLTDQVDFSLQPHPNIIKSDIYPHKILITFVLSSSGGGDTRDGTVNVSTPFPLFNWVKIPVERTDMVNNESGYAGIGVTVDIQLKTLIDTTKDPGRMLDHIALLVSKMIGSSTDDGSKDIAIIPWDLFISKDNIPDMSVIPYIKLFCNLLNIKRLNLTYPDNEMLDLIDEDTQGLIIKNPLEPFDMSLLSRIKDLKYLGFVGPRPNIPQMSGIPITVPGSMFRFITLFSHSLKQLRICAWFPLDNYDEVLNAISHLKALKILGIFRLYQEEVTAVKLAKFLNSLQSLEHLQQIAHVDKQFWMSLYRVSHGRGIPHLKKLDIEWDLATVSMDMIEATLMGVYHLLPCLQDLTLKFVDRSDREKAIRYAHTSPPSIVPNFSGFDSFQDALVSLLMDDWRDSGPRVSAEHMVNIIEKFFESISCGEKKSSLDIVRIAGLPVDLRTIERMGKFNMRGAKCKIEFKGSVFDCKVEVFVM